MTGSHPPAPGPGAERDWEAAIHEVLADPALLRLVFQPIVDLQRGVVVGFETLSRFRGPPHAPPDEWFAAAARLGCHAEMEAHVLAAALELRDDLPPNTFLTVNLDPNLLRSPEVQELLDRPLHRLVLEVTEHALITISPTCRTRSRDGAGAG